MALYPLTFKPIFKERVWGGRVLEELYHKNLPMGAPIGEAWEISDRPGDASVVANGPLAGRDLRWLMEHHREELLGPGHENIKRFPLLIKILDAREKLSLQVHPPADKAAELGGEPKTEMWLITDAEPGAELYVGLKRGTTRAEFERKIADGTVADCFHRVPVRAGDAMFLPSGRVHALGAGIVLFEVQENSDTTYRVFDWNRTGLDGKPRELHVAKSLASIDFHDFEPPLTGRKEEERGGLKVRQLADSPLFRADACRAGAEAVFQLGDGRMQILGVTKGRIKVGAGEAGLHLKAGEFLLLPASLGKVVLKAEAPAEFLHVQGG